MSPANLMLYPIQDADMEEIVYHISTTHDGGVTLPRAQQANLPAYSPHYSLC